MQKYTQLTCEQRYHIYLLNKQGYNQTFIAKSMGRNKSTISSKLFLLKELPVLFIKIERGFGSFLTFTTKNKSFLWVYLSDWIIYKNKIKILDCENDYDYSNVLNIYHNSLFLDSHHKCNTQLVDQRVY
jgi:hypothetical protein